MNDNIKLRPFAEADLDWLVEAHATLYGRDEGFDDSFGPLVETILRRFCWSKTARASAVGWRNIRGTGLAAFFVWKARSLAGPSCACFWCCRRRGDSGWGNIFWTPVWVLPGALDTMG